jgi:hypothetical protein
MGEFGWAVTGFHPAAINSSSLFRHFTRLLLNMAAPDIVLGPKVRATRLRPLCRYTYKYLQPSPARRMIRAGKLNLRVDWRPVNCPSPGPSQRNRVDPIWVAANSVLLGRVLLSHTKLDGVTCPRLTLLIRRPQH